LTSLNLLVAWLDRNGVVPDVPSLPHCIQYMDIDY